MGAPRLVWTLRQQDGMDTAPEAYLGAFPAFAAAPRNCASRLLNHNPLARVVPPAHRTW